MPNIIKKGKMNSLIKEGLVQPGEHPLDNPRDAITLLIREKKLYRWEDYGRFYNIQYTKESKPVKVITTQLCETLVDHLMVELNITYPLVDVENGTTEVPTKPHVTKHPRKPQVPDK